MTKQTDSKAALAELAREHAAITGDSKGDRFRRRMIRGRAHKLIAALHKGADPEDALAAWDAQAKATPASKAAKEAKAKKPAKKVSFGWFTE